MFGSLVFFGRNNIGSLVLLGETMFGSLVLKEIKFGRW